MNNPAPVPFLIGSYSVRGLRIAVLAELDMPGRAAWLRALYRDQTGQILASEALPFPPLLCCSSHADLARLAQGKNFPSGLPVVVNLWFSFASPLPRF